MNEAAINQLKGIYRHIEFQMFSQCTVSLDLATDASFSQVEADASSRILLTGVLNEFNYRFDVLRAAGGVHIKY